MAKKRQRNNPRRPEVVQKRTSARAEQRASRARAEQEAAEAKAREMSRLLVRYERMRRAGWIALAMAPALVAIHTFDHWDWFHVYDQGLEELTIGYPAAGVVALLAAVLLGQVSPLERR
ncbi:hypothetical protein HC251_18645 [Iamia sp. SCSIO 61187]|uniref:hypothetical protein n=1 Tax=Iamia sp. SCSIO 61187 TaxID=2722752 RepID=UPI001C62E335|nr:hypothetical protein [Iamia sp. SCSIO 61187]QYG94256.1 hypothetical protein HC251_18645 [Iamia sp. SCSIO 61187]